MASRSIIPTDFFSEVFHELYGLPLKGYAVAATIGVLNVVFDLLLGPVDGHFETPELLEAGLFVLVSMAAYYLVAMMVAQVGPTWSGALKFGATAIVSVGVPLGLLFGGLWLTRTSNGGGVAAMIVAGLTAMIILPMLAGWPLAQAVGQGFVSPFKVLKATKGHRWGLFAAGYLATAFNKILPATDTAKTVGQAMLLRIGNGAVSAVSILILAVVAATAWKFLARNDPSLGGQLLSSATD